MSRSRFLVYILGALSSVGIYLAISFLVYGVLSPPYENTLIGVIYTTISSYVSTLIPLLIILRRFRIDWRTELEMSAVSFGIIQLVLYGLSQSIAFGFWILVGCLLAGISSNFIYTYLPKEVK